MLRLLRQAAEHVEGISGHGNQLAAKQAEEIKRLGDRLAEADMWSSEKPRAQKEEQKHTKAESFVEHAQKWAASAEATLPKDLRLQIVTGAVEQIAPRLIAQQHMKMQLDELKAQQARIDERTSELDRKVIAHNIEKLSKAGDTADKQLKAALEHLDQVTRSSCGAMVAQLVADRDNYHNAVVELDTAEPGVLTKLSELSEQLVNVGALTVGSEVQVVRDDMLTRAKVVRDAGGGEWEVSLWQVHRNITRQLFEEGFDTHHKDLRDTLLATAGTHLVEHTCNDCYWGDGGQDDWDPGAPEGWWGHNRLGTLLTELREQLIAEAAGAASAPSSGAAQVE